MASEPEFGSSYASIINRRSKNVRSTIPVCNQMFERIKDYGTRGLDIELNLHRIGTIPLDPSQIYMNRQVNVNNEYICFKPEIIRRLIRPTHSSCPTRRVDPNTVPDPRVQDSDR